MVRALVCAALCVACQGQAGEAPRGAGSASRGPVEAAVRDPSAGGTGGGVPGLASDEPDPSGGRDARTKSDEPELPDPGRTIAELNAMPVWQAVVDRAQLLGRRGQRGVVYGRVGPVLVVPAPVSPAPVSSAPGSAAPVPPIDAGVRSPDAFGGAPPGSADAGAGSAVAGPAPLPPAPAQPTYTWLVDDTEGNGALGIRIALGDKAKQGDRIAAGGAWQLDAERRWFWKPETVQLLPPAPASDLKEPPPAEPSHAIAGGSAPPGARPISLARDDDAVYFQIVGPLPGSDGDGWQVADQLGSPAVALMILPGERPSYGGQDLRAPDERWQLKRGQTYWVRIGKLHKHTDRPTTVNARTAPIRVL